MSKSLETQMLEFAVKALELRSWTHDGNYWIDSYTKEKYEHTYQAFVELYNRKSK